MLHAQVLPYMYVHLVSLLTAIFLGIFAVEKGLLFTPEADYTYGLVLPFISWVIMCCSCVGLIEVGTTLANPFGSEPEDFAVFTFIDAATRNALFSIEGDLPEALRGDRGTSVSAATSSVTTSHNRVESSSPSSAAKPAVRNGGLAVGTGSASMITLSRRQSVGKLKIPC